MPPSEPPQQKMVIKSPSKPTLLGLTRTKASKAQLGSEPNGLSKSIGRTEAIKQQLFGGGMGEGNGSLARKDALGLSRTKSRVQLAPPDGKETGRPETSVSRVKSRVQVSPQLIPLEQCASRSGQIFFRIVKIMMPKSQTTVNEQL